MVIHYELVLIKKVYTYQLFQRLQDGSSSKDVNWGSRNGTGICRPTAEQPRNRDQVICLSLSYRETA